ncbi:hypothetical protein HYPSUDRAFT_815007 [Hypholoma sublateritium FD-334 SS-4]|uniref:Uncharacterized protein n=1 Tax=Hypholoma sublateritium (strain FD-334 SS-4) TaxID=945553 RepID=A0A0D2MAS6_HYPSF|nr:hypothetical protein HYPSUDRAFT_815007 [Hypholoma sublateritium FD-334 SS-4]
MPPKFSNRLFPWSPYASLPSNSGLFACFINLPSPNLDFRVSLPQFPSCPFYITDSAFSPTIYMPGRLPDTPPLESAVFYSCSPAWDSTAGIRGAHS